MAFKIETIKKRVEITLSDGTCLTGSLFLSPESPLHPGTELISELFENDRAFLPLELEGGEIIIIRKSNIVFVHLAANGQKKQTNNFVHTKPIDAEVSLTSGDCIAGRVYLDLPESRSRLSDFLNYACSFFYLETGTKGYLINSHFVLSVRPGKSQ
ncbi:MAG: hypothetical protein V2J25_08430 [Desulfatiglans sp.]|jgi:hypothetical protein|nr:hypothetical protein [Thermodesulfobacteriota bacterium]MEE4352881.1 hypothetical protein [Desulfatiglans sp.]